ncbi:transposase family protein, partial [Streptomyces sp. NPDC001351]|uniref:transposase family protein n=1 Tax=Streptomyces sp. NPDC001351 TaxID=3364564 RepID=UPI003691BD5A
MDKREFSWQDVLFGGISVVVEAAVCGIGTTIVRARGRNPDGCCPSCGHRWSRVHDRYHRQVQDVPLAARRVQILLEVRRFVCANKQCRQKTFAEQIPGLTSPFARCTDRLGSLLNVIALALAGRAGTRMPSAPGITVGRMGLLNQVRAMPNPSYATRDGANLRTARGRIHVLETELAIVRQAAKFLGEDKPAP